MCPASPHPPFNPPAAVVSRLRAAYVNCAETTLSNVRARFTGNSNEGEPSSIMALAVQNTNKEERLLGLTAEMPRLNSLHVWPLGERPALSCISPSGLFFGVVREPATLKDMRALVEGASGAYALQGALRRVQLFPRLQVELFGSGQGGIGTLVSLAAPSSCKTPWTGDLGGGAFCMGNENLFVFAAEPYGKAQGSGAVSPNSKKLAGDLGKSSAVDVDNYSFEVDWGEQQRGHRSARLCCVDFKRRVTEMLNPPEEDYAYGQPRFLPDGTGIVCTAWSSTPYCLGLQYCCNRRSKVYLGMLPELWTSSTANEGSAGFRAPTYTCDKLFSSFRDNDTDTEWLQLSSDDAFAAWSPVVCESLAEIRVQGDFTLQVAYLKLKQDSPEARAHACAVAVELVSLVRLLDSTKWCIGARKDIEPESNLTNVGEFISASPPQNHTFTGVYSSRLIVWTNPNYLFANTFVRNHETVVCLHPLSGASPQQVTIEESAFIRLFPGASLEPSGSHYSMKLLDVRERWLLLEFSSFVLTPRLLVAELILPEKDRKGETDVASSCLRFDFVGGVLLGGIVDDQTSLRWVPYYALVRHLRKLSVCGVSDDRHVLVAHPIRAVNAQKRSLAVVLHGGPHAVSCSRYDTSVAFLTMMGYDVLLVNYRGSLGFGQEELLSLLGKVGEQDVRDVATAVQDFLNRFEPRYDSAKTVLYGGSHGGFLTCHLLGQYSQLFAVAATRNPVTNLLAMVHTSDIPDFVYAEALNSDFKPALTLTPESITRCHLASPIAHAKHITTPLLIGIGAKDARVPPSQGISFYKTLLALGQRARLLLYPDADHRINQPYYAEDFWVNVGSWFIYYAGEPIKQ